MLAYCAHISQPTTSDLCGLYQVNHRNHRTQNKPQQGSHRPITLYPWLGNNRGVERHRSRDTSAIRSSQGGPTSSQSPSLPPHLPTSPSCQHGQQASPSPLLCSPHWPLHWPRRVVVYALVVLDHGAPECSTSTRERINPRTCSLSSNRAELSV